VGPRAGLDGRKISSLPGFDLGPPGILRAAQACNGIALPFTSKFQAMSPPRDSIPDRPTRSQSLYRLSYPAHNRNEYQEYFLGGKGGR